MKTCAELLLGGCLATAGSGTATMTRPRWVQDTFGDFSAGTLDAAGADLFITHRSSIRTTHLRVFKDGPVTPATLAPTGRTSLRYPLKTAGGAGSAEKTFDAAGIKNSCPTLIEFAPRDFRAAWDSGTKNRSRSHIRFGKFRVADKP
ncbi:MAG: hypothetical protein ACKVVO_10870 [Opitutaceae bacterium]